MLVQSPGGSGITGATAACAPASAHGPVEWWAEQREVVQMWLILRVGDGPAAALFS
jgi:hypothetical protein